MVTPFQVSFNGPNMERMHGYSIVPIFARNLPPGSRLILFMMCGHPMVSLTSLN